MVKYRNLKGKRSRQPLKKKAANLFSMVYLVYPKIENESENMSIKRTPAKMQCIKTIDFAGVLSSVGEGIKI